MSEANTLKRDTQQNRSYPILFSPYRIGSLTLKNRIVMTAMGVDVSDPDGQVNANTIAYYTERARGGAGLIVTEYVRVNEADGACATGQLSLSNDRYIPGFRKLAESVHQSGAKIFAQLHHPGRQNNPVFPTLWPISEKIAGIWPGYWEKLYSVLAGIDMGDGGDVDLEQMMKQQKMLRPCLAPSLIPQEEDDGPMRIVKTRAFTTKEIKKLITQFLDAAVRAKKAGADGVELHAAHGYLLQQFLSPHTNRRRDEYGGNLENRCRILKELIQGIHARCGKEYPVMVRLSVEEFNDVIGHPGRGIGLEEGARIAKRLEAYGADAINVSCASYDTSFLVVESMRHAPGWRKYLSRAIKEAVDIPVVAVSVIRTPEQAEMQLAQGDQDFIGLGRALLADPLWPAKAAAGQEGQIQRCISCLRCMETFHNNMLNGKPVECALNPRTCREATVPTKGAENGNGRLILVVGAGPAGLTAARELALRGFRVEVWEQEKQAGGQLLLAKRPPHKDRIIWAAEDLEAQAAALGVTIQYGKKASAENICTLRPYAVFLATGGYSTAPAIPGAEADHATTADHVLNGTVVHEKKNVAVVGSGLTGLETAELLLEQGNQVTVIEMADTVAPGTAAVYTGELLAILRQRGVKFLTGRRLERIQGHTLELSQKNGDQETLTADAVVLSLGVRSCNDLSEQLKGKLDNVILIGDAQKAGRIADAIHSAFRAARALQ